MIIELPCSISGKFAKFRKGERVILKQAAEFYSIEREKWKGSKAYLTNCLTGVPIERLGPNLQWIKDGCSAPGCGFPDGKPCIKCGLTVESDPCEWNPEKDRAAYKNEVHSSAHYIVGAKGQWRLCSQCANLPRFSRFRVCKPIMRE